MQVSFTALFPTELRRYYISHTYNLNLDRFFCCNAECVGMLKLRIKLSQKTCRALSYFLNADESVIVVKGSALHALEKNDGECVEQLISALDKIPLPKRLQVVHFY